MELCTTAGLPAWVDPMLDELAASLVVSRTTGATTPRCPSAPSTAAQVAQRKMGRPPLLPMQGQAPATLPRGGQTSDIPLGTDVSTPPWPMSPAMTNAEETTLGGAAIMVAMDDVNHTPSPHTTSADRHIKRFTKRITKRRQPPLLELPRDDTALGERAPPLLP